jgi:DNA primase
MSRSGKSSRIDVEALKRERPLADVISSYGVALRREGAGTFRALCPFHQEHTPSFWIDARDHDNEHYWCFGNCGAHGDVITFVMDREGCSFQEACERLTTNGPPPTTEPAARAATQPAGRSWERLAAQSVEGDVLELALHFYEDQLWRSERALAYLHARAVRDDVARGHRLGYADGRTLVHHLRQASSGNAAQSALTVALDLGLVVERPSAENGKPVYREFFFDRLIVPELRGGRPIWCIGRAVEGPSSSISSATSTPSVSGQRPRPKYLALPGEKPVLGLEHVIGRGAVYLVEGPLDWLAAVSWGLPAFAICGTHFPVDRLPAIGESLAVYGVFDPDRAGRSAAERFAPLFGSRWRPIELPNGLDLAELAALGDPGRENFRALVGRARAAAWQELRI